ncbi:hypothetical protein [Oceanidesulfovibrio marinus]|uniref:Spermidine synthase n=1 Tax=Oceanidesulfovibrio marinus TaxID=370038 RepID=A0A6P1ZE92_9BACT|nr:hypothetical protein [Oceanidesulfovibrio marinus]TVM31520.1 hypothetical protein DQK91_17790 [Oceanidesulfovibrio marinus]
MAVTQRQPSTERSPALLAVALVSAGAIGLEISFIRLFSASLGHDLAGMVISLALLGVGAAGSVLAIAGGRATERSDTLLFAAAAGFAVSAILCSVWGLSWEILPEAFSWQPLRLVKLGFLYVLLAVPFFFSGGVIGLTLATYRRYPGAIYSADLVGAGIGGGGALAAAYWLDPGHGILVASAAGFAAAAVFSTRNPKRWVPLSMAGLMVVCILVILALPSWRPSPHYSDYRDLGRALTAPDSEIAYEAWDPLGLITAVRSPSFPIRFAPGLSMNCQDPIPEQVGLYLNEGAHGAVTSAAEIPGFVRCLPTAAPFRLRPQARVLVLDNAGGLPVLEALAGGASQVDAVEPLSRLREALTTELAEAGGNLYARPEVTLLPGTARAYVEQTDKTYDVIRVSFRGPAGPELSVGEDFLRTREGVAAVLSRLAPDGIVCFSRPMEALPSAGVRLIPLVADALEAHGLPEGAAAKDCLAIFRGPFTLTMLASTSPFTFEELMILRGFMDQQGLDPVWLPNMIPAEANLRNVLEQPLFYEAAESLLGPDREEYIDDYPYDLIPPTDNRPYFASVFRWGSAGELYAERMRGSMGLLQWTYLLIPITLVQAVAAGLLFIIAPLLIARRTAPEEETRLEPGPAARFTLYFIALGLGYMILEIIAIKRLTLFMGGPVQTTAAVLGPFLVFSGVGAGWAQRWVEHSAKRIRKVLAIAILVAAISAFVLFFMAARLPMWAGLPVLAKAGIVAAVVAPLAVCLGFPFPLGLALVSRRNPRWSAWAFGVNGCASVAGPLCAQLLAVEAGFGAAALLGFVLYPLAWFCLRAEKTERKRKRRSSGSSRRR